MLMCIMLPITGGSISDAVSEADIEYSEEFDASGTQDGTATAQTLDEGATASVAREDAPAAPRRSGSVPVLDTATRP